MKAQYDELANLIQNPNYGVISCGLQTTHKEFLEPRPFSPENVPWLVSLGARLLDRRADFGHYHQYLGRIETLVQELAVLAPNWVDHAQLERERSAAAVKAEADAKAAKEQALASMLNEARARELADDAKAKTERRAKGAA